MSELKKVIMKEIMKSYSLINECNWQNKNLYGDYVAQTFYYVRHSTRLLALSASRLSYEQQQIHLRFIKHLGEESNHEVLALSDLKHLNLELNDYPEKISTRLFYEPQYYKIEHQNPLALMGYIIFLEVMAMEVCPLLIGKITEYHGKNAASFLRVHGEDDPEHVEQAMKMLQNLDPDSLQLIIQNINQSAFAYNQMLDELKMKWEGKASKKAA